MSAAFAASIDGSGPLQNGVDISQLFGDAEFERRKSLNSWLTFFSGNP